MKKALAILLVCLVMAMCSFSLLVNASDENIMTYAEAVEHDKTINTLFDERTEAELMGDKEKAEEITEILHGYGVDEVSYAEICIKLNIPLSRAIIEEYDSYRYEQYSTDFKIDGHYYTYMVITITPKTAECNLIKQGAYFDQYVDPLEAFHTSFISTLINLAGEVPYYGKVVTLADVLGNWFDNYDPNPVVDNVSAAYTWNIAETCSFTFMASESVSGVYVPTGLFNKVSGWISGTIHTLDYDSDSGTIIPGGQQYSYTVEYNAPHFGYGSTAIEYHKETGGIMEERLQSIEIFGLNGESITTVNLLNPQSPAFVRGN